MAKGQTIRLTTARNRQLAHQLVERAPLGAVLTIAEAARTNEQNAKLWAMLSDVARAKPQGRVMTTEAWKAMFMHAAGFQCTFEVALDGQGVVPLGFKSSRLGKAEFSDLIEAIYAYGSQHNVMWSYEREEAA